MADIESNKQTALKKKIEDAIATFSKDFDAMINSGSSLTEITLALNSEESKYAQNNVHNNLMSLAGSTQEFNGVFLSSEWYKRNLYMWSLAQKQTTDSDKRIMILAGASHTAIMELFIKENRDWNIKHFKDVISQ